MKVVAVVSYKYDSDHLSDLRRNLEGLIDDIVLKFDEQGELLRDEGRYRAEMYRQAESAGADYIVAIDPDERFERCAVHKLRATLERHLGERVMFEFKYRELYRPTKYRWDGIWGEKKRVMIFAAFPDNYYSDARLHSPHQPLNPDFRVIGTNYNIYHLKHIEPRLRENRKETYKVLDPEGFFNAPGYDYLVDETGLRLRRISLRKRYDPPYRNYAIDEEIFNVDQYLE